MKFMNAHVREHVHYALYSSIIIVAMLIHGNDPITSASSKLTIMLIALLIFGESIVRIVRRRDRASWISGADNG